MHHISLGPSPAHKGSEPFCIESLQKRISLLEREKAEGQGRREPSPSKSLALYTLSPTLQTPTKEAPIDLSLPSSRCKNPQNGVPSPPPMVAQPDLNEDRIIMDQLAEENQIYNHQHIIYTTIKRKGGMGKLVSTNIGTYWITEQRQEGLVADRSSWRIYIAAMGVKPICIFLAPKTKITAGQLKSAANKMFHDIGFDANNLNILMFKSIPLVNEYDITEHQYPTGSTFTFLNNIVDLPNHSGKLWSCLHCPEGHNGWITRRNFQRAHQKRKITHEPFPTETNKSWGEDRIACFESGFGEQAEELEQVGAVSSPAQLEPCPARGPADQASIQPITGSPQPVPQGRVPHGPPVLNSDPLGEESVDPLAEAHLGSQRQCSPTPPSPTAQVPHVSQPSNQASKEDLPERPPPNPMTLWQIEGGRIQAETVALDKCEIPTPALVGKVMMQLWNEMPPTEKDDITLRHRELMKEYKTKRAQHSGRYMFTFPP